MSIQPTANEAKLYTIPGILGSMDGTRYNNHKE